MTDDTSNWRDSLPEQWRDACGEVEELEEGILAFAFDVQDSSRLSCQIYMTEELDGIEVHMPERQY